MEEEPKLFMEELSKELSTFARKNRNLLKPVESWLNGDDFGDDLADAWESSVNAVARDWRKIVFLAWIAFDKKIYECEFEIRGFDPSEWCGLDKEGPSPQVWFLMDVILPGTYSGKQHPNLRLIRDALEEGKKDITSERSPIYSTDPSKEWVISNGQVSIKGQEIKMPSGQLLEVLGRLVDNMGKVVPYDEFEQDVTHDRLRHLIKDIRHILENNLLPFEIMTTNYEGYRMRPKTSS